MSPNVLLVQGPIVFSWLLLLYIINRRRKSGTAIPTIRQWPTLFPEFLDRLSYNRNAERLITKAYQKVDGHSGSGDCAGLFG